MESGVPGTPIKRRLTAILAADAVGYSRQMSENEERTLQVLAAQRAIIDRIIAAHGGRIVGTAGDSVLAEFPSSVEAVRCAVEVQEGLETRNAGLPEQERLVFRIGVNLGDVMVDGADILGDGVNVAARLEGIADPGGICISSSVYDQIAGKLNLGFVDIGEKSLKNISRPIRVYRFDRSGEFLATPRRPRSRSRTMWIGASAAAVLAIAAVATWRSGVFEARPAPVPMASTAAGPPTAATPAAAPSPSSPPTAAPAAAAPTPEAASEETKLKLRIAEAERAKAEAELARSRAEAEAAKQRARSERKESAPAPAPASAASVPPATPGATASGAPASATPATAAAKPEAPVVVAVSKASGSGGADAPPALAANGKGTASRFCDAWEDAKAFNDVLQARVVDGEVIVERGLPGQPGFVKMTGKPTGDGRLTLLGSFISTLARVGGREHLLRFDGTYGNGQYSLNGRLGARSCTVIVRLDAH
jgi:class 3 adenylate cyclase